MSHTDAEIAAVKATNIAVRARSDVLGAVSGAGGTTSASVSGASVSGGSKRVNAGCPDYRVVNMEVCQLIAQRFSGRA